MRLLVTGALGHIGSRLLQELPQLMPGTEVVGVDDLSSQRYASLFHLPSDLSIEFHEQDILEARLEELIDGCDAVVHLAALTDAANSHEHADAVERTNFHGTIRVAEACRAVGAPLVFPSTTSVYGSQASVVDEDCPPEELKPQSPYAVSKLRGEEALRELGMRGLRHVTLRLGTIFGPSPGMRFHTAVNKFIWQAVLGRPLTVWRTALDQMRPYLAVEDACAALCHVVHRGEYGGELFNVVTTNATVREITDLVRAAVGRADIELVDSAIMNQLSYEVRGDRFAATGFRCSGNLEAGISATVALLEGLRLRELRGSRESTS